MPQAKKKRIALYCEYNYTLTRLLWKEIHDNNHPFEIVQASDIRSLEDPIEDPKGPSQEELNQGFLANCLVKIKGGVDATEPSSYEVDGDVVDVAVITAPFPESRFDDPTSLVQGIAKAAFTANVEYIVLSGRWQDGGAKNYGRFETYHAITEGYETVIGPFICGKKETELLPGYVHWFTRNGEKPDTHAGWTNATMFCAVYRKKSELGAGDGPKTPTDYFSEVRPYPLRPLFQQFAAALPVAIQALQSAGEASSTSGGGGPGGASSTSGGVGPGDACSTSGGGDPGEASSTSGGGGPSGASSTSGGGGPGDASAGAPPTAEKKSDKDSEK